MGMRRNKREPIDDLNLKPVGADLPPLEFRGKRRTKSGKRKQRSHDQKGRRYR
jgi:hypothetical protein